jgi:hypothetical protein
MGKLGPIALILLAAVPEFLVAAMLASSFASAFTLRRWPPWSRDFTILYLLSAPLFFSRAGDLRRSRLGWVSEENT